MAVIVVSDTSPLSGLAIAGYLPLLEKLYDRVLIPLAVEAELIRGGQDDLRISQVLSLDWIEVREPENLELVASLRAERNLDRGESEAIALALELEASELLIDERLGRREASRLGLQVTGVLGILLVAKHRGLVAAIRPIIDQLISEADFRVSSQLYTEVLVIAGENDR